jgi:beta-xylosidase
VFVAGPALAAENMQSDRSKKASEFHSDFRYSPAKGLGFQEGVTRRDPSDVIKVGSAYYVWYTRTTHGYSGYNATVWYATSSDGHTWTEKGQAVGRGEKGAWDERSVFTPNILVAGGSYYLFYTAVPEPFDQRTKTAIGLAVADSPDGVWRKFPHNPVLTTGKSGKWLGMTGTKAELKGDWDSHRVDDACLITRDGKYWLYYKGRQMGLAPRETKMGLAVAAKPTGPYVKHADNPLIKSGHEVLVWPCREGVVSLIGPTGPQKNTIQYAPDGLCFSVKASVKNVPKAPGAYRPDAFADTRSGVGITWGISMVHHKKWPYLVRYDCDLRAEK